MSNHINIKQLNSDFGITDNVNIIPGKGGLPIIDITNDKAHAQISVYAAQVLSYHLHNEPEDMMFVSENAYFQPGKAIKGGIPICWPWFGKDQDRPGNPDHGFARNNFWSLKAISMLDNGDTRVSLELVDTDKSQQLWPYAFYLSLNIVIGDTLTLNLVTRNTGNQAFSITEALHTYFYVGDARQIKILGLEHTEYLDKTENFVPACQLGAVTFTEETDHIHTDIKHDMSIEDPVLQRRIKIRSSGNKNVVVWNPWDEGAAEIKDLDAEDYKHFICVEVANAATDKINIQPGDDYKLITNYSIERNQ